MDVWKRAQACIAQGGVTNSKNPNSHVFGVYPTHVTHGQGCYLFDVDGRKYLDFVCGLGANLFGYGNPQICDAISRTLAKGISHSWPTVLEVETAEELKTMFPCIERLKFLKTGTEACMAALKIARAHTGRSTVLSEGYHGWSDPFVSMTPPAFGVPKDGNIAPFLKTSQIDQATAAVIVEPVSVDASVERMEWLIELREACSKNGAMLIFDEIITGGRFAQFSVAKSSGVTPDIICLGKSIGGGMPLAVVGGAAAVMNTENTYFVSSTFAGEVASLAACREAIKMLKGRGQWDVEALWAKGQEFLEGFNSISPLLQIHGYPTRGAFVGQPVPKALFFQEACKAGILFGPSWFFNWHLSAHTDVVLNTCKDILGRVDRGEVDLEGELPQSPFSAKVRKLA